MHGLAKHSTVIRPGLTPWSSVWEVSLCIQPNPPIFEVSMEESKQAEVSKTCEVKLTKEPKEN